MRLIFRTNIELPCMSENSKSHYYTMRFTRRLSFDFLLLDYASWGMSCTNPRNVTSMTCIRRLEEGERDQN